MNEWLEEKQCAICGKLFYPPDKTCWAYKREKEIRQRHLTLYFCSWGCLRKYERGIEIRPDYSAKEYG